MFLDPQQVQVSFDRLGMKRSSGKSHLERTSCLMYFLAFDALSARLKSTVIDFDPDKEITRINRRLMDAEFSNLILLDSTNGIYTQVLELGKIERLSKSPSMRIASNFYSVPLSNAASSSEDFEYPRRPKFPILSMGNYSTSCKWGVSKHVEWKKNLPVMLENATSNTPFTDLAVYVLRKFNFTNYGMDYINAFPNALRVRFTAEVSEYWSQKMSSERPFVRHMNDSFSKSYISFQTSENKQLPEYCPSNLVEDDLHCHIRYLEGLLKENGISFKHFI